MLSFLLLSRSTETRSDSSSGAGYGASRDERGILLLIVGIGFNVEVCGGRHWQTAQSQNAGCVLELMECSLVKMNQTEIDWRVTMTLSEVIILVEALTFK